MLFVLFTLDTDRYVIDASQVERMLPLARDTPPKSIPGAPSWVAGVIDHEGTPLPVIDLPALTLGRPAAAIMSTRMVLVRYPLARAGHDFRVLAVILEGATRTIRLDAGAFHETGIDTPHARFLGPVANHADGIVQWVKIDQLLTDDVKALLFPETHA